MANRIEGISLIKDKICDVIYKRNEKLLSPLISLFGRNLSVRMSSSIDNINQLFDILDRLNLGSVNNLWAFVIVADFLKDPELQKLISDVGHLDIPDHLCFSIGRNLYAYRRANKTVPVAINYLKSISDEPPLTTCPSRTAPSTVVPEKQDQVLQSRTFDLLACEVGRRWRELGRSLDFHESDLDEFDDRQKNNLRERIYTMLQEYAKGHSNTRQMITSICTALDKMKRVDLRKRVQQFMSKSS